MIFLLLILYQIKHFICDYPLQGQYMLGKFKGGTEWILPLLAHVGVHGLFTAVICLFFNPSLAIPLAIFDMTVHFIMDRIKASPNMLGKYQALTKSTFMTATNEEKKSNVKFWWALGLDQGVHHLTHYAIIYWLVTPW